MLMNLNCGTKRIICDEKIETNPIYTELSLSNIIGYVCESKSYIFGFAKTAEEAKKLHNGIYKSIIDRQEVFCEDNNAVNMCEIWHELDRMETRKC